MYLEVLDAFTTLGEYMFDIKDNSLFTLDNGIRGFWQQIPVLKTWISFRKRNRINCH